MPEETQIAGEQTATETTAAPAPQTQTAESSPPSVSTSNQGTTATEPQIDAKADEGKSIGDALKAFANEDARVRIEPKKVSPPTTQQQQTSEQTQQTQQQESKRRDYSGLNEDERKIFRDMSAESFAKLRPLYDDYKKLKSEVETLRTQSSETAKQTFFENPDAYQLTPEYQHNQANLRLVENEKRHWKAQHVAIRNGQKWVALVGYDNQGNPQYSEPQEPTAEAEADITDALQVANQIHYDLTSKLNGIKTNHATQHKGFMSKMSEIDKQIFKDADLETLNKAMATKLPLFPQYMHNNPQIQTIAKLLAVIDGYAMLLEDKKAAAVTAEAKTRTLANGGPPPGARTASGGPGKTVGGALSDFEKARMMGVY